MLFGKKIINWKKDIKPDFIVGGDTPYLLRWYLIPRNPFLNIYLHCFKSSDINREFHDHPWSSLSYIIQGMYSEITDVGHRIYKEGQYILRIRADVPHRIELIDGECWTLFVTSFRYRNWYFYCRDENGNRRMVPWEQYVDSRDKGKSGKGCG